MVKIKRSLIDWKFQQIGNPPFDGLSEFFATHRGCLDAHRAVMLWRQQDMAVVFFKPMIFYQRFQVRDDLRVAG